MCIRDRCDHLAAHLSFLKIEKISAKELNVLIKDEGSLSLYPNVNIALTIFLCLMVTNCTGERSFSVLKRIKNYLRSTQTQDRLNDVTLLNIEGELTMALNCDDIINEFAERKARKKFF